MAHTPLHKGEGGPGIIPPRPVKTGQAELGGPIESLPELFKVGISTFVDSIKNQYGRSAADAIKEFAPSFEEELTPLAQNYLSRVPYTENFLPVLPQIPSRLSRGENILAPAGGFAFPEINIPFTKSRIFPPFIAVDPRSDLEFRKVLTEHEVAHVLSPGAQELKKMWEGLSDDEKGAFAAAYGDDFLFDKNAPAETFALAVEAGLGQAPAPIREAARSNPYQFFSEKAFQPGPLPEQVAELASIPEIPEILRGEPEEGFLGLMHLYDDIASRSGKKNEIIFAGRWIPKDDFTETGLQVAESFIRNYEEQIRQQEFQENMRLMFESLGKIRSGEFEVTGEKP